LSQPEVFSASASLYQRALEVLPGGVSRNTVLLEHLLDQRLIMINTCSAAISTAMGISEIELLVSAMKSGFEKLTRAR